MSGGTLALSWGPYGGFYVARNPVCCRLCLGWLALTWVAVEIDDLMIAYANELDRQADSQDPENE